MEHKEEGIIIEEDHPILFSVVLAGFHMDKIMLHSDGREKFLYSIRLPEEVMGIGTYIPYKLTEFAKMMIKKNYPLFEDNNVRERMIAYNGGKKILISSLVVFDVLNLVDIPGREISCFDLKEFFGKIELEPEMMMFVYEAFQLHCRTI